MTVRLCIAAALLLSACAPTGAPSRPDRPDLGCLDRATATAIAIENGSRDSDKLRPCN